jgi:hypothetical protein
LFVVGPDGVQRVPDGEWVGDRLRYLLARRLAREFRFREAAQCMPAALKPHFAHYVKLHRAMRSGTWPDETRAAILWNLASLRRHLGMDFFGYEGTPDNTHWDGAFAGLDFAARRSLVTGWHFEWNESGQIIQPASEPADLAVPRISREELSRLATFYQPGQPRFHYRHDAADIAWRAAALLPDNDPATLFMLHEAGRWLAHRDPQAADRFYQEIISRCAKLPEWPELELRRWFLPKSPPAALPELPAALRFHEPDVAGSDVFPRLADW